MPSLIYRQVAWAIENRIRLFCIHKDRWRICCPITLWQENGAETANVWLMDDESASGPLPDWRTFQLDKVSEVAPCEGDWERGPAKGGRKPAAVVDYYANENSPYDPTRSWGDLRGTPFPE